MSSPNLTRVPQHLAIVMDGNGRWARQRLLPRLAGHRQGMEKLREVVRWAMEAGVGVLTVFAFSSENWRRPAEEVEGLMDLLARGLEREIAALDEAGVQLHFPGQLTVLAAPLRESLERSRERTAGNHRLVLNVCFNYGGRWDIVQAARQLAESARSITEESLSGALALAHVPDPDLFIRTGGERRVSNFLLWQMAYSEWYFSDSLWPAFERKEFDRALQSYAVRERRFGQISEQVHAVAPFTEPV